MEKLRFLLVEDSRMDRELIEATLLEGGLEFELVQVETKVDFVLALNTITFDLILADYSLPDFDGLSALEMAQNNCPKVPFIFVSGVLGEELAIDILKSGATDYVLKQRLTRLVPAVERALREAQERRDRFLAQLERQQTQQRLAVQYAVSLVLAKATTLSDVIPDLLKTLCQGLEWQAVCLWRIDEADHLLHCVDCWHSSTPDLDEFIMAHRQTPSPPNVGFLGQIWDTRQPLGFNNFDEALAGKAGINSVFGFPIQFENRILGVIECFSQIPQELDNDLLQTLISLGNQIGQFIERKRIEETLQETQELFELFMSNIPASAFIKDESSRYIYVNSLMEGMYNRPLADWLGKTDFDLFPSEIAQQYRKNDLIVFATNQTLQAQETGWLNDEEHYYLVYKFPFQNSTGLKLLAGLSLDITDRKQAEFQLQEQAKKLSQLNDYLTNSTSELAQRNEELDRFVYVVSHDLKAPLRAISNLTQWITEDLSGQLPEENQSQLVLLFQRVQRLELLIDGLLEYSRVGRGKVSTESVDVGQLLCEIVDSLVVPDTFVIEFPRKMPTLVTKRLLLNQVFSNLISNAIKHHNRPDGRVEISVTQRDDYYEFAVIDDGPGIATENHERIFGIFQTLTSRDKRENTGIGLSIVKKIIETEGGEIFIESQLGKGATFRFTWRSIS